MDDKREKPITLKQLHAGLIIAKTVDDVHDVCSNLCDKFGFDNFHYGAKIPTSFIRPYHINISGFPSEWWNRYKKKSYVRIDPTVEFCSNHHTPLIWDDLLSLDETEQDDAALVMNEAREFGLKSGVSIPLHSAQGDFVMFSLASKEDYSRTKSRIQKVLPHAQLFTGYLHESVRRIYKDNKIPLSEVHLTDRETECLLWAAEGKTTWETAQILDISDRTIIFHIQNAVNKLNSVNRSQAIARAVAMGLIKPQF